MNLNDEMLFRRAEKVILSHELYLRDNMSRSVLDDYVHIPKNKLALIFREFTGMTFPNYINSLRLKRAAEILIEHPTHTIESVANDCGIPVAQTFYRLFRDKYGMTPTEYRRKQKTGINKLYRFFVCIYSHYYIYWSVIPSFLWR